ncbi:MAG: TonB-dependent receptor, partial [Chitinophagaceae bacterium]|nr:TonB-dependent receptor [Chitinophagaceae bacterium]
MFKKIVCPAILVLCVFFVCGQQKVNIEGTVSDSKSASIGRASVHILNTNYGTYTNDQGKFRFENLKPGKYLVSISATGYTSVNEEITAGDNKAIHVVLAAAAISLDEVVVSAQKRDELIQKLPFSISAFSSEKVREYRLWNNKDITAIVPNLIAANPGDDRNVTSIRGITTTSYDPAVATYIDGVNQFSLDTYISPLFDVERIEVLRGPQGTLYGRNAMGGVINIITKAPANQANGYAELNVGNYGQQRYVVGLRTPVIKDKLFFGVSGMYKSMDGFYTNDYNNSKFDKQHSVTGNFYLKYLVSQRWILTLNVKNHVNRNNGPFSLVNGVEEALNHPYHLNQNATTTMVDNTFNSSFSVNYTGPVLNFSSQTAWQTNYRYYKQPIDGDFSPIDGVTIINNYGDQWNKVKVLTQEFRFTSPASLSSPWKWTTGVYLFHQDVPNKQATRFGNDADLLGSPDKNFSIITTSKG